MLGGERQEAPMIVDGGRILLHERPQQRFEIVRHGQAGGKQQKHEHTQKDRPEPPNRPSPALTISEPRVMRTLGGSFSASSGHASPHAPPPATQPAFWLTEPATRLALAPSPPH